MSEASPGQPLASCCLYVRHGTNNQAEYGALALGLAAALRLGVARLRVLGDSQLVVDQVNGRKRVHNAVLRRYHAQVRALAARFAEFRIEHVYREGNRRADALSNEAIDAGGWDGVRLHGEGGGGVASGRLLAVPMALDLQRAAAEAVAAAASASAL